MWKDCKRRPPSNNAMAIDLIGPLITSTIVAAPIAVPDEFVTATPNSHIRKKAKTSYITKKDRLVDNFAAYNTQTTNRGRSVHTASHCCCMTCIVDENKGEVHSVNMKTCYESNQKHKHLSVTCWGKGGSDRPVCYLCTSRSTNSDTILVLDMTNI